MEKSRSIEAELQTIAYDETPPKDQKNLSALQKLKIIFLNISVEPIMVLYVWPSVMAALTVQNLNLEKACRVNLHFDQEVCDAMAQRNHSAYTQQQEQSVQRIVASMNAYKNLIQSLLPTIMLVFLGSWSDRHQRRKPCIVIPVLGDMCSTLGFLISVYFFMELPVEFNCFFEAVPPAITGGWFVMFMGIFSYISGVSSVETRTLRIGAVNIFFNVSITVGIAMSGILYNKIGFYGVFGMGLCMYATGLIYALFRVKEEGVKVEDDDEKKKIGFCKDFFDIKHVKDTIRVVFKKGKRNRRRRVCILMLLVMVIIGPVHGELNVMYLFVRYKFGWNEIDYSLFSTFNFVVHITGTLFSLMFFSKFLKLDDALLGMISSLSKIASSIIYTFAPNPTVFYLGAVAEIFNGTSFIAMRSIVSKLVPPDELGKINSLFGVSEALMPLVYGPLYSVVYNTTINYLPGAFFIMGGGLTVPAVIIFLWLYFEHRKDAKEEQLEKEQKEAFLDAEGKEPAEKLSECN